MGIRKIKSEYTEYFVLPKSKNKTFIYKTAFDTTFTYIARISDKYDKPMTYCVKSKDNLIIITKYFNPSSCKLKTIKTTIKNYFKVTNKHRVIFNNFDNNSPIYEEISDLNLYSALNGNISDDTENYISASKKSDKFTLSNSSGAKIFDEKGNETYTLSNNFLFNDKISIIQDFSGKDKYYITKYSKVKIFDYGGKDKYTITASNATITDYSGNDEYILKDNLSQNVTSTDTLATISDKKGDDVYEITDFDNLILTDEKGKDNYTVKYSKNINIVDKIGNDNYKFFNSDNLLEDGTIQAIIDYSGKDNYKIDNCRNFYFEDFSGNDKYQILNLSENIIITDYAGLNDYNFKNSNNIEANDKSASAKTNYTLEKMKNSTINDYGGSDKYIIDDSLNILINDYNTDKDSYKIIENTAFKINDFGISGDKYEIVRSSGIISDNGGDDVYSFTELSEKVEINDSGGFDTLKFKDCKKADLIFMTEITSSAEIFGDLIIYDFVNKGYVKIDDFYEFNNTNNCIGINNARNIEKIYSGKEEITSLILTPSQINSLNKENIAKWLSDREYNSVTDALNSKPSDINNFIEIFSNNVN